MDEADRHRAEAAGGDLSGDRLESGFVECLQFLPSAPMRPLTVKRSSRGISGVGSCRLRSYCSKRFSVRISITSRNPSVVTSAVLAPRRSISALVASVVPWMMMPISEGEMPASRVTMAMPSRIACSGAA
jgi:hypothetical protein